MMVRCSSTEAFLIIFGSSQVKEQDHQVVESSAAAIKAKKWHTQYVLIINVHMILHSTFHCRAKIKLSSIWECKIKRFPQVVSDRCVSICTNYACSIRVCNVSWGYQEYIHAKTAVRLEMKRNERAKKADTSLRGDKLQTPLTLRDINTTAQTPPSTFKTLRSHNLIHVHQHSHKNTAKNAFRVKDNHAELVK